MKSVGLLFIAAALLLSASAWVQDAAAADKPYASIISRNMFGLLPIPPPPSANAGPPAEPKPKITPNGIMMLFGKLEALFKVASKGKAGQPPGDVPYVLAEGEMQDGITVVKINQAEGTVTFDNHGEIQPLALVAAANTTSPAAPGGGPAQGAGSNPGQPPRQSPLSPAARAALFGSQATQNSITSNPGNVENAGGPNNYQPPGAQPPAKTIEDQVISAARDMALIEQNRIATQPAVDAGLLPPLPPTMLTPADAKAAFGSSLIAQPEDVTPPPTRR